MPELTPEEKQKIYEEEKVRIEAAGKIKKEKQIASPVLILILISILVFSAGFIRFYFGGQIGFKITNKESFSFQSPL